jgi:hypothetical protein
MKRKKGLVGNCVLFFLSLDDGKHLFAFGGQFFKIPIFLHQSRRGNFVANKSHFRMRKFLEQRD